MTNKTSNAQPASAVDGLRRGERRTSNVQLKKLARRIAKHLFTGGAGERAQRLVFELPGQNFLAAGWGELPVADLIERYLRKSASSPKAFGVKKSTARAGSHR